MQPDHDANAMVVLGKITGVFGVKGWVKIHAFTAQHEGIFDYGSWYLQQGDAWQEVKLVSGQRQGKGLIAQFEGIDDRDQALALVGLNIGVQRTALPALADNEYYWSDLFGLSVMTVGGHDFGKVDYLLETGANDVMVVQGEKERWLPWIMGDVIKEVDLKKRLILVDWDPDF